MMKTLLSSKSGRNRRSLGSVFESVAESAAASIAVNQAASVIDSFVADPSLPTLLARQDGVLVPVPTPAPTPGRRGIGSIFASVAESAAESAAASFVVNQGASAVESFVADPSIPTPILPRQPPISERALEPTPVARKFPISISRV